jgi:hypothetical protein
MNNKMSDEKREMSQKATKVNFSFYGLEIEVTSDDRNSVDSIRRDFTYFESEPVTPEVHIELFDEEPPYSSLPDLTASIYSTNYITYWGKEEVYTDFHGRGLRISEPHQKRHRIYSADADLRYEMSYLTMLSEVGGFLDSRHIHRVHALGMGKNGKAVLILLPESGGKSTLALSLLRSDSVSLLSEDSPLITRRGEVLPFPLRLGVLPGGEIGIPEKYLRPVKLTRAGTKILVDVEYYINKIGSACKPGVVLLGERVLSNESRIESAGRLRAGGEFIKNSVIGLGLHQGLEYLLGRNIWGTVGKTGLALSRFINSVRLLNRSGLYRFLIGHDTEKNIETLLRFLDELDL